MNKNMNATRMPVEPVLIVEDTPANQNLLSQICESISVEFEIANNGQEALDLIQTNSYSIFIVDLMMPVIDGKELIESLKENLEDPIILVQTALGKPEDIISVMRLAVYDYVVKPIDVKIFTESLKKALEIKYLRDQELIYKKTAESRLKKQFDVLNLKGYHNVMEFVRLGGGFMNNMRKTLSEGRGPGTVVPVIDMIKSSSKETPDGLLIDSELAGMLFEINDESRKVFQGMDNVYQLLVKDIVLNDVSSAEVMSWFTGMIDNLSWENGVLENKVHQSEVQRNEIISCDAEALKLILEELLVNSINNSPEASPVDVFSYIVDDVLCVAFKNESMDGVFQGANVQLFFEPFYRADTGARRIVSRSIIGMGLGLGLTIAANIISKHGGQITLHGGRDHTGQAVKNIVLTEVFLPLRRT